PPLGMAPQFRPPGPPMSQFPPHHLPPPHPPMSYAPFPPQPYPPQHPQMPGPPGWAPPIGMSRLIFSCLTIGEYSIAPQAQQLQPPTDPILSKEPTALPVEQAPTSGAPPSATPED